MAEIWRASGNSADWEIEPLPQSFSFWWACWLLSNFVGQESFRLMMHAEEVPKLLTATKVSIAADLLSVIASLAFIPVIKGIMARQQGRATSLEATPPAARAVGA